MRITRKLIFEKLFEIKQINDVHNPKECVLGGAIDDFSKAVAKVPYVATVELSGTDRDGYANSDIMNRMLRVFWFRVILIFATKF